MQLLTKAKSNAGVTTPTANWVVLHLEFHGQVDSQQSASMLEKATHVLYLLNSKLCAGEETITVKLESTQPPYQSLQLSLTPIL